jgi:hypothetical protein
MGWVLLKLGCPSDELASELAWGSDQLAGAGELIGARGATH